MFGKFFKVLLFFVLIIVLIFLFSLNNKILADTKIDLSGKTITASPDTNKYNAIDGNLGTSWGAMGSGYWTVDLGSVMNVYPKMWAGETGVVSTSLNYSQDGSTWTTISASQTGGSSIVCNADAWARFDLVDAKYFKFERSMFPGWGFGICEFEVYTTGGGTPTPTPPTPTPSGSLTPTPSISPTTSTSGTPTVSPTSSGETPPIEGCINPPCVQNPDDPIFTPDENFNIVLEVPNGGEKWKINNKYKIKWKSTDSEHRIKSIALFLSTDGGENFKYLIKQNLLNDGEEEWTIPNDEKFVTDRAKMLVAAYGDSIDRPLINDKSDDDFRIIKERSGFLGTEGSNIPLFILTLILFGLGALAVLWPQMINFLLNSFMTDLLNRLPLLTAPTLGNKKSTGIVYDSKTQSPIPRAVVRIFNAENDKQLESIITNQKGEFSFLVPSGSYYLKVNSTQYDFPSKILNQVQNDNKIDSRFRHVTFRGIVRGFRGNDNVGDGNDNTFTPGITDGTYQNLYFGQKIIINKEKAANQRYALNINIPLDKTSAYNVQEKMLKILRVIGNVLAKIKWPSIGIGTVLSIYSIWTDFSILHLIILELYLILILYEAYRLLAKTRPYGLVMDEDKMALDLAVVRFNQNEKIKATSISGSDGKFTAQVNPGDYNLSAKKNGFFETEQRNIAIKSARRLEKLDILMKKA